MENNKLREFMGVLENTPILNILLFDPMKMFEFTNFGDNEPEHLKIIHDRYSLIKYSEEERYYNTISLDILIRDINDPNDINYIELKRRYQYVQKYVPNLIPIFFYNEDEETFLENKYKNIIDFTLQFVKDDLSMDSIIILTKYNPFSSNRYMQGLVDKVIHGNFNVINEIIDNELFKKYYVIKKKENEDNDNNAN